MQIMDVAPPYPSLLEARRQRGNEGVRELLAWYVEQPTYLAAAKRLGTAPCAMTRAARAVGFDVPKRLDRGGAPLGSVAAANSRKGRGLPPREEIVSDVLDGDTRLR